MIFVTVGTERFPFDRLIRAVDQLQNELQGEEIFMQIGSGVYTPSCAYERFLPYIEFCEKVREARIVVSHAGAGTLLMCAELGKTPIMMTRKQSLKEHVDDHQQMLAEQMVKRGRIILVDTSKELLESIRCYDDHHKTCDSSNATETKLALHLKDLLSEISNNASTSRSLR